MVLPPSERANAMAIGAHDITLGYLTLNTLPPLHVTHGPRNTTVFRFARTVVEIERNSMGAISTIDASSLQLYRLDTLANSRSVRRVVFSTTTRPKCARFDGSRLWGSAGSGPTP